MKRILVEDRKKGVKKFMLVDDEDYLDFKRPSKLKRPLRGKTSIYVRKNGFMYAKTGKGDVHRLVLKLPPYEKRYVDHINGNTLDNRKENLRLFTPSQNRYNSTKTRAKSGYKGVYIHGERWRVVVVKEGKRVFCQIVSSPKEGSLIYKKVAKEVFGEFAPVSYH